MNRVSRMHRGLRRSAALATVGVAIFTAVASAGVLEDRLDQTRTSARQAKSELGVIDERQQALVKQVSVLNDRIQVLEGPLQELETSVDGLDYQIERRTARIAELRRQREQQRVEITRLTAELGAARDLLEKRVVAAYMAGDTGMVEQLAGAGDLRDLFQREEALSQVVGLDEQVIGRIASAERGLRVKRARNVQLRFEIRRDIASLKDERASVEAKREQAQAARDEVAAAKADRDRALQHLHDREQEVMTRLDDLEGDAKVLQDVIKNGSTAYAGQIGGLASASGLIWPVNGPVVSPFGQRWGRLHAGIDIAVPSGTPIGAAAAGVVIYAGWESGYGNFVLIQHANGLATAYGHQTRVATSVGQMVTQGQVIGFSGCTGHCFGPHVHFETRVNGAPQDPMQYL
ncbi:MAG: Peptidase [Thermoleophilia bacterium]|nr:Peptidase [Thermoleophilia bacterium]